MRRRLPIITERALADAQALQIQTGSQYEQRLRQEGRDFSCRKGCSWCCHHPFLITIAEGILLFRNLKEQGLWSTELREKLANTRDKTIGLSHEVWLLSNIPCALLKNGECQAYAARPLHCRATFSTGDPFNCHPHELGLETALVSSSSAVIIDYMGKLQSLLKKVELPSFLMPLSEAVILGSQVDSGELEISEIAKQYLKDLI